MATYQKNQRLLKEYYTSPLCPVELLFKWLRPRADENAAPMTHREISISMARDDGREIYRRWMSAADAETWRTFLISQSPVPHKFDFGGIYTKPISRKDDVVGAHQPFFAWAREFVLDIDMNDYDEIRICCEGKSVCSLCWRFIAVGAKILDEALRQAAGFQEIFWIFSGRRGIHCWVTDAAAKKMSNETRSGLAHFLELVPKFETLRKEKLLEGDYEKLALKWMAQSWGRILAEQNIFFDAKRGETIRSKFLTDLALVSNVTPQAIESACNEARAKGLWGKSRGFWNHMSASFENGCKLLLLRFLQPRLDINVSKDVGHLLKSPFCVHHATGKICVPISLENIDEFDPTKVPTLRGVVGEEKQQEEIDQLQASICLFEKKIGFQQQRRSEEKALS